MHASKLEGNTPCEHVFVGAEPCRNELTRERTQVLLVSFHGFGGSVKGLLECIAPATASAKRTRSVARGSDT